MVEPRFGHIHWGFWSVDYFVAETEGLSLLSGYFKGRRIFTKLSLPVIRVKYLQDETIWDNPLTGTGCGPYNDQISWDPVDFGEDLNPIRGPHHLVRLSDCGDRYICVRTFTDENQVEWLEVAVYARIGAYHIYQNWRINNFGDLIPRIGSKGLSCNVDHWHHPYWRFNFNIDEMHYDQVNIFSKSQLVKTVNREGFFANKWFEENGEVSYNVENIKTGIKAWIFPPRLDPEHGIVGPDPFSGYDVAVRKYRQEEDVPWPFPPTSNMIFENYDFLDTEDIVFWMMCHLFHKESEGKDHWHWVGPNIKVQIPEPPQVLPGERRKINVTGKIHIKDFKLVGHDKWGHYDFNETVEVDSHSPYSEVFVQKGPTGDVRVNFLVRIKWQIDKSVSIDYTANLFDEEEVTNVLGSHFNVLRDISLSNGNIHLVDYHSGDPDTGDIEWGISNSQA